MPLEMTVQHFVKSVKYKKCVLRFAILASAMLPSFASYFCRYNFGILTALLRRSCILASIAFG